MTQPELFSADALPFNLAAQPAKDDAPALAARIDREESAAQAQKLPGIEAPALHDFAADIPPALAAASHQGTSFFKRAAREVNDYAATLAQDLREVTARAKTDEARAEVRALFDSYHAGFKKRTLAYLASSSRCVSSFIAGPSGFPAARMNKRADIAHRRLSELLEYRKHMIAKMERAARPDLRPIMLGDDDATTRLEKKLAALQSMQERMKAANAAIRKHAKAGAAAQVAALGALNFTEAQAHKLLAPDFAGRIGFPSYEITNNGANIRRVEKQLEVARTTKAQPATEQEGTAARLEDCPQENRVRLFFPGKPDAATIAELKRNAFRWTPSLGCWQAFRNSLSIPTARRLAGLTTEQAA